MTESKRVSRRSLGSDLAKIASHVIESSEYDELPELTDDMLARGVVNKVGRPKSVNPKKLISIRLTEDVIQRLAIDRAGMADTYGRQVESRCAEMMALDVGSKVIDMARLVDQVQALVEESGTPAGFDAAVWVADWLQRAVPALGGRKPAELMETVEGRGLVSQLIARMQSGAYS